VKKHSISEIEKTPLGEKVAPFVAFLKENDIQSLEKGKYDLSGGCKLSIAEITTKTEEKWEAHKEFIDIQYVLTGDEKMGFGNVADMNETVPYNSEKDVLFYDGKNGEYITVSSGEFVIFGVEDAHAPGLAVNEPSFVKKAIVKIPV